MKRLWFWDWTTSSNSKRHSPFVPPLNTDIVFRTITLAHVPKITPAPTPMFVKSVQVNIGANFAKDKSKQTKDNSSKAPKPTTSIRK